MSGVLIESWAIAKRELKKRYSLWKDVLSIIILLIVLLGIGRGVSSLILNQENNQSYTLLFSSGMIGIFIIIIAISTGMDFVVDKKGFNKLLLVAPISRISIIFGKAIYLIVNSIKTIFITGILLMLYFNTLSITHILLLLLCFIFSILLFLGFVMLVSSLIKQPKNAELIFQIILFYFMFGSGAMYNIANISGSLKLIFYMNPATYVVELSRYIITGNSIIKPYLSAMLIIILGLIFSILGTYFYDKKLRQG